jgi:hypothetical protein
MFYPNSIYILCTGTRVINALFLCCSSTQFLERSFPYWSTIKTCSLISLYLSMYLFPRSERDYDPRSRSLFSVTLVESLSTCQSWLRVPLVVQTVSEVNHERQHVISILGTKPDASCYDRRKIRISVHSGRSIGPIHEWLSIYYESSRSRRLLEGILWLCSHLSLSTVLSQCRLLL